jgi:hypothetical protein
VGNNHSTRKTVLIWLFSLLIFIFIALRNRPIEAFPPQLNYESIYQGRVFLHVYDLRNRDYINDIVNTAFNQRVLITARVTIYAEAPVLVF